ncbi:uncharacterized protein PGTG_06751 [Puccinia graminis f. sp. tritici CRL 75-36-700-3]|uniref:Uncharacterized protein n=1 Tax=Puccinia graminis f. sp. tritici (strain CRL 75-36-700-3 / race SCCL) TaxID=418459 RepID=E3K8U9_PUCGT|nr:uncharacterized protein PGTG_06751 [Puccinia graminis f. sp. tritici CRL 75-36-700-3]EFP80795.2 hypothetical protein PGTG_06751 [Puccinia graminis f. sp. tritici CRL 75-36-700-3]
MALQGPSRCPHERVRRAGLGEAGFKGKSFTIFPSAGHPYFSSLLVTLNFVVRIHKGPDSQVNPRDGTPTQRVEVIQQQHKHQQIVGGMAEYWRLGATVDATKNIINSACHE